MKLKKSNAALYLTTILTVITILSVAKFGYDIKNINIKTQVVSAQVLDKNKQESANLYRKTYYYVKIQYKDVTNTIESKSIYDGFNSSDKINMNLVSIIDKKTNNIISQSLSEIK